MLFHDPQGGSCLLGRQQGQRVGSKSEARRGQRFGKEHWPTFSESQTTQPVLVVEDEHCNAEVLQFLLKAEGYRVAVAPDGRAGLALLDRERPAVILSDFAMPDLSGAELGLAVRANPLFDDMPFVMLSGTSESVVRKSVADYDAFVKKPYQAEALMRIPGTKVVVHHAARPWRELDARVPTPYRCSFLLFAVDIIG